MVYNDKGYLDTKQSLLREKILSMDSFNYTREDDSSAPLFRCNDGEFEYDIFDMEPLIDSSDMNSKYYCELIQKISELYHQYNIFIILHGTDTLAYTAAMLTVFIENSSKPFFITGSAYSIFEDNRYSDAYANILSTFEYACLVKKPGVYVCCKDKLLDSTTCKKYSNVITDMFYYRSCLAPNPRGLPEIYTKEVIKSAVSFEYPQNIKVATLFVTPLNHIDVFLRTGISPEEILVIHAYGNGNVPLCSRFMDIIKKHTINGGLTIVVSQCPDSLVAPLYSSWEKLISLGVLPSNKMTVEFLFAKISYLIAKKVPKNLMKLLIYIDFTCKKTRSDYDDTRILKELVDLCGVVNLYKKFSEIAGSDSSVMEVISNQDLVEFFKNPILYYKVFMNLNGNFEKVENILMKAMFVHFKILADAGLLQIN